MISFSTTPTDVALSGNELPFSVRCTDLTGAIFRRLGARLELRTTGAYGLTDEDVYIFITDPNGPGSTVQFFATATPTTSLHLPAYDSGDLLAYWQSVAEVIQAHPDIEPYCTVYATANTGSTYSIWLVAREYATGWSIEAGPDGIEAYLVPTSTDTLASTYPDSYRCLLDVMVSNDMGELRRIVSLSVQPDTNSYAHYNVSSAVDAAIRSSLPELLIPAWDTSTYYTSPTQRTLIARAYERSDDEDYADIISSDPITIHAGAVAQSIYRAYDYINGITAENSFLTWRPDGQKVSLTQPYYLAWYAYAAAGSEATFQYLQVKTYTENGTTATVTAYTPGIRAGANSIVIWPVSPAALAIDSGIKYYQVRVVKGSGTITALSPWRTFYIDTQYYHNTRVLAYLNSFYCPEIVRFTGDLDKTARYERNETTTVLTTGAQAYTHERRQDNITWEDIFTYRSGFLTASESESMRELLHSPRVYEISSAGYVPLVLDTQSFGVTSSRRNLHTVSVSARPALQERVYSKLYTLTTAEEVVWGSANGIDIWGSPLAVPWGL